MEPGGVRVSLSAGVAPERVVELFGASPPSWIRPALTLAGLGIPQKNPSFRLGRPEPGPAGAVCVPLCWFPDGGAHELARFDGQVVIAPGATGTVLALEGSAEGGEPTANLELLTGVLRRIVRALEAAYGPE